MTKKNEGDFTALYEYIDDVKDEPGNLMPIMQKAQDLYGAIGFEVQKAISEKMEIPMSDIYGVATFYSQFALTPKGEHLVSVCMGTACYVRGADSILAELEKQLGVKAGETTEDNKFTLEATRCLGCCGLAPVIMIDEQVFGGLAPDDIQGILKQFQNVN